MIHLWWAALGVELQAAAIGAGATVISTAVAVLLVRAQIRSSARQSRDATSLQHEQAIRIELYREVAVKVGAVEEAEGAATSFCQNVLDTLKRQPWAQPLAGLQAEIERLHELERQAYAVTGAQAQAMIAIEKWRIAEPRLQLFLTAFNVAAHDIREHATALMACGLGILKARVDGGKDVDRALDDHEGGAIIFGTERLQHALSVAGGYAHDTRIELQNLLLSDIFPHRVPSRVPLDPSMAPLSLDKEAEQLSYFNEQTAWARYCNDAMEQTRAEIVAKRGTTDDTNVL